MKKSTVKKLRRFMTENNVAICDVTEIIPVLTENGFHHELSSCGIALVKDDDYAPQWVHNVIRKLASMPKFTANHPHLTWWEILCIWRKMNETDDVPYFGIKVDPIMDTDDEHDYDDWDE